MDNSQNNKVNDKNNIPTGPLIDVSSSPELAAAATISPNAVRSRIGVSSNGQSSNNTTLISGGVGRSSPAVPGSIHRSVANTPHNVLERHLVRRTYEEQSHTTRQTAVGSRLAADTSPSGSAAGDIASENLDSLSLQLSPHLNRRSSSTVPCTPVRHPQQRQTNSNQQEDIVNKSSPIMPINKLKDEDLSDTAALQLQAELKRTLESSNSNFTSLVDISAPVTKWKRAMSLPQNDFARAMCHRSVAKSLAQNIRSALRSSPSTVKETLPPGELRPPPCHLLNDFQPIEQEEEMFSKSSSENTLQRNSSDAVTSSVVAATPTLVDLGETIETTMASDNNNNNNSIEDIWVLRESYIDKLGESDRQWKTQHLLEEHGERRLHMETTRRMGDLVNAKTDESNGDGNDEMELISVFGSRQLSSNNDDSGKNGQHSTYHQRQQQQYQQQSLVGHVMEAPSGSRSLSSKFGGSSGSAFQRLRTEPSHIPHSRNNYQNQQGFSRDYNAGGRFSNRNTGADLSDYSDREDDEPHPSLLKPFSNLLAGRKGAYSKVPTLNDRSPGTRPSTSQYNQTYQQPHQQQQQTSRSGSNGRTVKNPHGNVQQLSEQEGEMAVEYPSEGMMAVAAARPNAEDYDTDEETDKLLEKSYQGQRQIQLPELAEHALSDSKYAKEKVTMKEVRLADPDQPSVLLEGVLFRCRYLGSTQIVSESQPSKPVRMMQAQEAVGRIKAPYGEAQPSTDVDLFISYEKVMVLSTNLQDIIMDHALKTISYVADLDDVVVLMTRRRQLPDASGLTSSSARGPQLKMLCHVFESDDAHHISDAIGEAFHLAYMAFLRANGIEDPSTLREVDNMGEENIGPQDIFNDDLPRFVDKNHQRDVVVSKSRGEALGIVVVESGWGSVIPTIVVANMLPTGPAARSGQLNIGDQLLSVNGISLVGLPMTSCQNYIKAVKNQTAVRVTLIRCPPVTEVLIKRPDAKYQLGFSVHNGIICSLLRGGIAERGGVRVGHRIIEINGDSVVAVSHERVVNLLSNSLGEIRMKTMPMSIFRLLTGQDTPNYI